MGGLLALAGHQVTLVNRHTTLVNAINQRGLLLKSSQGQQLARPRAAQSCAQLGAADLLLVLVKSFDTENAMAQAAPVLGAHTVVLSLQNGLGHEDTLAAAVGRERVLAGKTYVGGQLEASGEVIVGNQGKATIIGELDGVVTERATRIAQAFTLAGLHTSVSENIMGVMWDKLLVNVATGAISGITRLPYGGLYSLPQLASCAMAAVAEGMAVARAQDVAISITDPAAPWHLAGKGLPAAFKASILQSLERGARTEIDYINGAVVRLGALCSVPTPVNSALVACIKGIEYAQSYQAPEL